MLPVGAEISRSLERVHCAAADRAVSHLISWEQLVVAPLSLRIAGHKGWQFPEEPESLGYRSEPRELLIHDSPHWPGHRQEILPQARRLWSP